MIDPNKIQPMDTTHCKLVTLNLSSVLSDQSISLGSLEVVNVIYVLSLVGDLTIKFNGTDQDAIPMSTSIPLTGAWQSLHWATTASAGASGAATLLLQGRVTAAKAVCPNG